MRDTISVVLKGKDGTLKEHRHVSDDHELASSYTSETMQEVYTTKRILRLVKGVGEVETAKRFLNKINHINGSSFVLSDASIPQNSPIDCIAVDTNTSKTLNLQIRVSDDEPIKDLVQGKIVHRSGKRHEIHHRTIKRAILSKSTKYPAKTKVELILLLDGWLGVQLEDIEEFKSTEQELLKQAGFREIWFVGEMTIERLI